MHWLTFNQQNSLIERYKAEQFFIPCEQFVNVFHIKSLLNFLSNKRYCYKLLPNMENEKHEMQPSPNHRHMNGNAKAVGCTEKLFRRESP